MFPDAACIPLGFLLTNRANTRSDTGVAQLSLLQTQFLSALKLLHVRGVKAMFWPGFKVKTQVRFSAYILVFAGLGALLAWLFQWRTVLQVVPGRSFMSCDTACCFILAGLTFLFALRKTNSRRARSSFVTTFVLGAIYLWADLSHTWFSLHSLFPEFTNKVVAPFPLRDCRTSTATALAILQLGAFLLVMTYSAPGRIATSFAAFVATVLPAFGVLGIFFFSLAGGSEQDTWISYLARHLAFHIRLRISSPVSAPAASYGSRPNGANIATFPRPPRSSYLAFWC